jgi:hypothetical protein
MVPGSWNTGTIKMMSNNNNNSNNIFKHPNPLKNFEPNNLVQGLTSVSPPKLSPLPIFKDIQKILSKERSLNSGLHNFEKNTRHNKRQHHGSSPNRSVLFEFNSKLDDEDKFVTSSENGVNEENMRLLAAAHLDFVLLPNQTLELNWKGSVTSVSKKCRSEIFKPGCYFFHFYNYEKNKSIRLHARAYSHGREIYCVNGDHVRVLSQTSFTWNIKCQKEFEITISLHLVGSIRKVASFELNVYKEQLDLNRDLVSSIPISNVIKEDLTDVDENEYSDDENDENLCKILSPSSRNIICSSDWDVY